MKAAIHVGIHNDVARKAEGALTHLEHVDALRRVLGQATAQEHKAELGQFMTPQTVARFMAGLFGKIVGPRVRLLDAGAGIGSLSCAFLDHWLGHAGSLEAIEVDACEVDPGLRAHLAESLQTYAGLMHVPLHVRIEAGDFIEAAVNRIQFGLDRPYTHAILNPPYRKIGSTSRHRLLLRQAGIETVNLYSAFVALALAMLAPGGQIVAIIPRSFCNGPYYRPFREFVLSRAAIRQLHLFGARDKAFRDDAVLQENIIVHLECGGVQGDVRVSMSSDDRFADLAAHDHAFDRIVFPGDPEHFIHVPTSPEPMRIEGRESIRHALKDLGIEVSTGPVVDFRVREFLRPMPGLGTAPLLYSGHFVAPSFGQRMEWPKPDTKKPNAILRHADTDKWLYPAGHYTVVRRFSTKEEKRRVVAGVVDPAGLDSPVIGFENHLNVFHAHRAGLPEALARGLAVYLNSTLVDEAFRRFNGHTQVNATDLRLMKYPPRDTLVALGEWAMSSGALTQEAIDDRVEALT